MEICKKYNSEYCPLSQNDIIILVGDISSFEILSASRLLDFDQNGKEIARWFIFLDKPDEDFPEKEISFEEIKTLFPEITPYLSLSLGFNFIFKDKTCQDVWWEET